MLGRIKPTPRIDFLLASPGFPSYPAHESDIGPGVLSGGGMKMRGFPGAKCVRKLVGCAAITGALGWASATYARPATINPNIPDFYQHQDWERLPAGQGVAGWEGGGGWCRPTAMEDTFYSLRARGFPNLTPA